MQNLFRPDFLYLAQYSSILFPFLSYRHVFQKRCRQPALIRYTPGLSGYMLQFPGSFRPPCPRSLTLLFFLNISVNEKMAVRIYSKICYLLTESQNSSGWEGPLEITQSNLPAQRSVSQIKLLRTTSSCILYIFSGQQSLWAIYSRVWPAQTVTIAFTVLIYSKYNKSKKRQLKNQSQDFFHLNVIH